MKNYLKLEMSCDSIGDITMKADFVKCTFDKCSILNDKDEEYIPTKGDKLYFMPGVNVPRVKMKDLTLQYGIKSVRNIEDATHIFTSRSTEHKMTHGIWLYHMPTDMFRIVFDAVKDEMDDHYSENIREALEHYTEDRIVFDYSTANTLRNGQNKNLKKSVTKEMDKLLYNSHAATVPDPHYIDFVDEIMGTACYDESQLLKYINGEDAVIIDADMFNQLSTMFESSDDDNHILAMEIMANCKYMESLLYLELLFKEYSYDISNRHTKNHVNFKSLISFLGKDKNYLGTNIDDVMESLINKQVLTEEHVLIILDRYHEEIENGGDRGFFKVKTITLNDVAHAALNKNFTYTVKDDFVPEVNLDQETEFTPEENEALEEILSNLDINTVEEELLELEETPFFTEDELNATEKGPEDESNNNQIEEENGRDGFEWF